MATPPGRRSLLRRGLSRLRRSGSAALLLLLSACGLARCTPDPLSQREMAALYERPLPPPDGALAVYHLGHSLVGRDMPAMLGQLASAAGREGHRYDSQLGWGTTLKAHWEPDVEIGGFETENDHPRYRDATGALESGEYDAVVLTEMVEIRDAIAYFDSWDYLARWARLAWQGNPDARIYLYETWHNIDDPEGFLERIDRDLGRHWEGEILARALAADGIDRPIHVIPAGQAMAAFLRSAAERGGVGGISEPADLFAIAEDGTQDTIHVNDLGLYLVALTHFAVLYGESPVGLPNALSRADGSPADAPAPEAARLMQETVWEVVTGYPKTGVSGGPE